MRILLFGIIGLCPLLQDSTEDIDRAIRALSDQSKDARQKAQATLLTIGTKALPALKKALESEDVWIREGAKAVVDELERPEREKTHDAANRKTVMEKCAQETAWYYSSTSAYPDSIDMVACGIKAKSFQGGLVIGTSMFPHSSCEVEFDVTSVKGKDGKDLAIERCGKCSPAEVYVRDPGPTVLRIKGVRRWYSEYKVEFTNPQDGDTRRVGDFTITVKWPTLVITARRGIPEEMITKVAHQFDFELKNPSPYDKVVIGSSGGGGRYGGRFGPRKWWCNCQGGPQPIKEREVKTKSEWTIKSHYVDPNFPEKVDSVASITIKFSKPIEEPFEIEKKDMTASGTLDKPPK